MSKLISNPLECGYRDFIHNDCLYGNRKPCKDDKSFPTNCPLQDGQSLPQVSQKTESAEEMLYDTMYENNFTYVSFPAFIENESSVDVFDIVLKAFEYYAQSHQISQEARPTDADIERWATSKCIKEKSRFYADISTYYSDGAKAMRDGQIPTKGEKAEKVAPFDYKSTMMDGPENNTHKCFVEPLPGKPNLRFKKK